MMVCWQDFLYSVFFTYCRTRNSESQLLYDNVITQVCTHIPCIPWVSLLSLYFKYPRWVIIWACDPRWRSSAWPRWVFILWCPADTITQNSVFLGPKHHCNVLLCGCPTALSLACVTALTASAVICYQMKGTSISSFEFLGSLWRGRCFAFSPTPCSVSSARSAALLEWHCKVMPWWDGVIFRLHVALLKHQSIFLKVTTRRLLSTMYVSTSDLAVQWSDHWILSFLYHDIK